MCLALAQAMTPYGVEVLVPLPTGIAAGDVLVFYVAIPAGLKCECPKAMRTEAAGEYSVLVPVGLRDGERFRAILPSCDVVRCFMLHACR